MVVDPHRPGLECAAIARARTVGSRVHTLAPRPNARCVGPATPSRRRCLFWTTRTAGPKSSSSRRRASAARRRGTVGSWNQPGRLVSAGRLRSRPWRRARRRPRRGPRNGRAVLADERAELDLRIDAPRPSRSAARARRAARRRGRGAPGATRDPLDAGACLTAVGERAPERALDGAVEVGVVEHEHRVLAAELEHGRGTSRSAAARATEPCRPRSSPVKTTACDAPMADERLADGRAGALNDADEARRGTGAAEELLDPGPAERRQLGRLDDRGVAGCDGGRRLPERERRTGSSRARRPRRPRAARIGSAPLVPEDELRERRRSSRRTPPRLPASQRQASAATSSSWPYASRERLSGFGDDRLCDRVGRPRRAASPTPLSSRRVPRAARARTRPAPCAPRPSPRRAPRAA